MKRYLQLLIIFLLLLSFIFCKSEELTIAPDFTLQDINGNLVRLSDFRGKIIILNFWATWCPPCRKEIPIFIKLYKKYKDEGLVIIGISLDRGGKEVVIPFVKKYGINYPVLIGTSEVEEAYGGIRGIPTTFIIDKEGKIRKKHIGLPMNPEEFFENEFLTIKKEI
ncbi:TlpA family protein disulfide reductase [Candidatus Aminicenantes bacterium AC-335-A11]|jgi:peroxiredoxin|nr:TlpA family protein disulfide reductase [SCandidatus Aminicenantes bacterium Aminicenantia_JdfR_composite]MCP2596414.1 TlpA family protein disulfide reductase [Candidatus Aminicenantes bacterium AC-335-G13]MCP2606191.1 TlpA family protein disulfide reductase [Candidatus Aminicenantes bacterium AC-708-I09]MCP2618208.1 TlpA family protein disulfide reductase [Candidatus Aminicenantes bacterium AC-335-A11]